MLPQQQDNALAQTKTSLGLSPYPWQISISFSRSHSPNFKRALYLAKQSPQYLELDEAGEPVYQATYSADPKEFLSFVRLYEMISLWKSAHVMINGQLADRKVVGNINYCYGDNCRSGNPDFCFGASRYTENPFGCHRLQISANNNPWTCYYDQIADGTYKLDKVDMRRRIDHFTAVYKVCPSFDYEAILERLDGLPSIISEKEHEKYERTMLTGGLFIGIGF